MVKQSRIPCRGVNFSYNFKPVILRTSVKDYRLKVQSFFAGTSWGQEVRVKYNGFRIHCLQDLGQAQP